jgi:hypothetical protein
MMCPTTQLTRTDYHMAEVNLVWLEGTHNLSPFISENITQNPVITVEIRFTHNYYYQIKNHHNYYYFIMNGSYFYNIGYIILTVLCNL